MGQDPIRALITTVSAMGIWYIWAFLYRDLRIAEFRQRLFLIRDELFDYAAAGHISFDHPAYGELRMLTNGLIRIAHRVTFFRYLLGSLSNSEAETAQGVVALKVNQLPVGSPEHTALMLFHARVLAETVRFMVNGSLLLRMIYLGFRLQRAISAFRRSDVGPVQAADDDAGYDRFAAHLPGLDQIEEAALEESELAAA